MKIKNQISAVVRLINMCASHIERAFIYLVKMTLNYAAYTLHTNCHPSLYYWWPTLQKNRLVVKIGYSALVINLGCRKNEQAALHLPQCHAL